MANTGSGGTLPGSAFLGKDASDVMIKTGTTLLSKPASQAAAETALYGVEAVNTCLVNSSIASADDGKYFLLYTQASTYVVYADEDGAGANKPSVSAADYYIAVPYTDADAAGTFAAAIKTAINNHTFAKTEILATLATATVTMTAIDGGVCDAALDVDFGAIITLANPTPGAGDFDNVTKTAEGQIVNIEADEIFNTGQNDIINLTDKLTFEVKFVNFTAHNYNVMRSKYHRQTCQIVFYDINGTTKRYETFTVVVNVQKITEDGIPMVRLYGEKSASDITGIHAVYDMLEE